MEKGLIFIRKIFIPSRLHRENTHTNNTSEQRKSSAKANKQTSVACEFLQQPGRVATATPYLSTLTLLLVGHQNERNESFFSRPSSRYSRWRDARNNNSAHCFYYIFGSALLKLADLPCSKSATKPRALSNIHDDNMLSSAFLSLASNPLGSGRKPRRMNVE